MAHQRKTAGKGWLDHGRSPLRSVVLAMEHLRLLEEATKQLYVQSCVPVHLLDATPPSYASTRMDQQNWRSMSTVV